MQNGRLHNIPSKTENYIFTAQASGLYSSSPIAEKINKRQKSLSSGSPPPRNPYPDKGSSSLVHADVPHHSFTNNLPTTIKLSNFSQKQKKKLNGPMFADGGKATQTGNSTTTNEWNGEKS